MPVLPIVSRELSVQARRKSTHRIRLGASATAMLFLFGFFLVSGPMSVQNQGQVLFLILSSLIFAYALLIGPFTAADAFSAEKRNGTLGLLFLTDLKGHDVVLGKLFSTSIHVIYILLAVLPMMAVALIFGGVSGAQLGRVSLVLGNALFLSLAAALAVSTVSRDERKAVTTALLIVLLFIFGPYVLAFLPANNPVTATGFQIPDEWLWVSPLFTFMTSISIASGKGSLEIFYSSLTLSHAAAWFLLIFSWIVVPRTWRDRVKGKRGAQFSEWKRRWTAGFPNQRVGFRRRLLDRNPCFWLFGREFFKPALAWILILPMAGIGYWVYSKAQIMFYETALVFVFLTHVLFKVWFTTEVSQRWVESRNNGSLELLFTSPFSIAEMMRGQSMALRRQFAWPAVAIVGLTLLAWLGMEQQSKGPSNTSEGQSWLLMTLPVFLADLATLRWVGVWRALTTQSLNRTLGKTLAQVLFLRWPIFLLILAGAFLWDWIGSANIPFHNKWAVWLILALGLDLAFANAARRKVLGCSRSAVADPSGYNKASPEELNKVEAPAQPATPTSSGQPRSTSPKPSAVRSRRYKWGIPVGVVLLFLAIFLAYRFWLNWRIDARVDQIQQAGFPITLDEWKEQHPANNDNHAFHAGNLLAQIDPALVPGYQINPPKYPRNFMRSTTIPPGPDRALTKTIIEALDVYLATHRTALNLIHQAPSLAKARFDVSSDSSQVASELQTLKSLVRLLEVEVYYKATQGKVPEAVEAILRNLDVIQSLENRAEVHFALYRRSFTLKILRSVQWLLCRHSLTESELTRLQQAFARAQQTQYRQQVFSGLQCLALDLYRNPPDRSGQPGRFGRLGLADKIRNDLIFKTRFVIGANERDLLAFLDALPQYTNHLGKPYFQLYRQTRGLSSEGRFGGTRGSRLFRFDAAYPFETVVGPLGEHRALCQLAVTALAIERYRLDHAGQLPKHISDLVPEYLAETPTDPFNGRPLNYQTWEPYGLPRPLFRPGHSPIDFTVLPLQKGYTVYSIGRDGIDQGAHQRVIRGVTSVQSGNDLRFSVNPNARTQNLQPADLR